jgi:hypothetical protein
VGPVYYGFAFAQIGVTASLALGAALVAAAGVACALMLRHPSRDAKDET